MAADRQPGAGVDRLVQLGETQEKRSRGANIAKGLAGLVAIAFFAFVGYCVWLFIHEAGHPL